MQKPNIEIRELTIEDSDKFVKLRQSALRTNPEAFGSTIEEETNGAERFKNSLQKDGYLVLGTFKNGELVGMCGYHGEDHVKSRHKGVIWGMFVEPKYRGLGIGKNLLKAAVEQAFENEETEQIILGVVDGNNEAYSLYENFGFKRFSTEKNAFKKGGKYWDLHVLVKFKNENF